MLFEFDSTDSVIALPYIDVILYHEEQWNNVKNVCNELLQQRTENVETVELCTGEKLNQVCDAFNRVMDAQGMDQQSHVVFQKAIELSNDQCIDELFTSLPCMLQAVLDFETHFPLDNAELQRIELFRFAEPMQPHTITLNRNQFFSILCHGFFGLFASNSRFNFVTLMMKAATGYSAERAKLMMILHYYFRVASMTDAERQTFNQQTIEIQRHVLQEDIDWLHDDTMLSEFTIIEDKVSHNHETGKRTVERQSIEDQIGAAQADFANKYIGGGALSGGCVQEEIRFSVCPEALVSMLFHPPMQDREAIIINGAEQFSKYAGYGFKLRYLGDHQDKTPVVDQRVQVSIICIDAADYRRGGRLSQYTAEKYKREINKVYAGLQTCSLKAFATGNWGCGVFRGDICHKALLQWIAASKANMSVLYLPFGEKQARKGLPILKKMLNGETIAAAYKLLQFYERNHEANEEETFIAFIDRITQSTASKPTKTTQTAMATTQTEEK